MDEVIVEKDEVPDKDDSDSDEGEIDIGWVDAEEGE